MAVSPTVSQLNLHEIIDFTKHFTDLGIPVWYCLYGYDFAAKNKLFGIGRRDNKFEIAAEKALVNVCNELIEMKKERKGIFITTRTLNALKNLFMNGQRTWKCKALQGFFVVDQLGRVAGCHCLEPVASVFELLDVWDSPRLESFRREYSKCDQCAYLCYIFYSLHASVLGNIGVIRDQWKNVKLVLA